MSNLPAITTVERLEVENFTAFGEAMLDFSPGFNVLVGENGTGKTHLMKLVYSVLRAFHETRLEGVQSKSVLEERLATKLKSVFKPDELGRLVRRGPGKRKSRVRLDWTKSSGLSEHVAFELGSQAKQRVSLESLRDLAEASAIFLPSREVLSFYPGFAASYDRRELEFDATYYDLCRALEAKPLKRGPREAQNKSLAEGLEEALGAKIRLVDGRFKLRFDDGSDLEAHLVAEGLRKLTTVLYLVLNGSLTGSSMLFWDEPESNLNPRYVSIVVDVLKELVDLGVQVFLSTHDYLVSQKLSLLATTGAAPIRFFMLTRGDDGVRVEPGESMTDFDEDPILDEFARQYDLELQAVADS